MPDKLIVHPACAKVIEELRLLRYPRTVRRRRRVDSAIESLHIDRARYARLKEIVDVVANEPWERV